MEQSRLQKVMSLFGIGVNKDKSAAAPDLVRPIDDDGKVIKYTPLVDKYWKYWANNCHDDAESFKNIQQVYQDMDMLYYNSPLFKRALTLMADETVQSDSCTQPINIEAKPEVQDKILRLFDDLNLYSTLRLKAESVIQYGNAGEILNITSKGIEETIIIDIYDLKSILEFTPYEVRKKIEKKDKFLLNFINQDRLKSLVDTITNKDDYASYFKSYTLGYQVADFVLPPWRFLHYKNPTSKSPFKPFGIPEFIHTVSTYRQYDAAITLQMAARGANLPIDRFSITAPNTVDPVSKLNLVLKFIRQYQNSGFGETRKEQSGVGETIFTIKDLFDYDQISSNIDLGKIDDIELLRNDMIVALGIPRNLVDPNDTSFGDSGVSLIQKWKPFARQIFKIQSILLENITQLVKIHMILSGTYNEEDMKFILSMPYPEGQVNGDLVTNQKDLLDLSNTVLQFISDRFLNSEPVPIELSRMVMMDILPYNKSKMDTWMDIVNKSKDEKQATDNASDFTFESLRRSMKGRDSQLLMERVKVLLMEEKVKALREGAINGKHYYTSSNINPIFNADNLLLWDKAKFQREEIRLKG